MKSDRPLSPQSETEYTPMSVESARHNVYVRASSPDSMPEFKENQSLSPDSTVPEVPVSLLEYVTWASHGYSSHGSSGSESNIHEQNMANIHEEMLAPPQASRDQDLKSSGEEVQHPSDGELKDMTQGSAM
ncbi:hypothetical protein NHX12_013613, partial [Muraenolepis orangiensis]